MTRSERRTEKEYGWNQVIDGIKRNSTIYVGNFIVRKTDTTLNEDEDIVV